MELLARISCQMLLIFWGLLSLSCFSGRVLTFPSNLIGKDDNVTAVAWNETVQELPGNGEVGSSVNSKLYKTVKRYTCNFVQDTELLLFGSQAWTFPEQDVELKLSYPSESMVMEDDSTEMFANHVVTGIDVVLYTSGRQTKAFISSGGMLQKNIGLTFRCTNTTNLGYQFRVYGWPQSRIDGHRSTESVC